MNIFEEDITSYKYLMSEEDIKDYRVIRLNFAILFGVLAVLFCFFFNLNNVLKLLGVMLSMFVGYKFPFMLLKMRHKRKTNEIIDVIPIWVNIIYSLIGENNIYNSILLSYENCPSVLKSDLKEFIDKITIDNDDKYAYISFLQKYHIEGFRDIMMKIYEFRNLSKDKLKYEISSLNNVLGKLEKMKRERRFKSELFVVDTLVLVMLTVPCVYMFYVSLLISEMML